MAKLRIAMLGASTAIASFTPTPASATAADTTSAAPTTAEPASTAEPSGLQEIVVTATKRSESLNKVPISVSALSGNDLVNRGIAGPSDLAKAIPGFTFIQSQFGPPVFTLRGIGFYDSSIGSKPSVSVYQDEVPIPFSIEAKGASIDLERVEVLKGPQGTLFGQNATGGAVNYIAAKPTDTLKAGLQVGYGSFNAFEASGFVSGPISNTLSMRVAASTQQGGAYQRSLTRAGDKLGDRNFTAGRVTIDFKPSSALKLELGFNGYIDKSDPLAAQSIILMPLTPNISPDNPLYDAPLASTDNRSADWTPGVPKTDNSFYQIYLRGDLDLTEMLKLTSISAYSHFKADYTVDPDGMALDDVSFHTVGKITSLSEELRLAGDLGNGLKFIVGGNISRDRTQQTDVGSIPDSTSAGQFAAFGLPPFNSYGQFGRQQFISKAVFGNVDYDLGEYFTVHGGIRYTKTDIDFTGCSTDNDGNLAAGINALLNFVVRPAFGVPGAVDIPKGGCVTINTTATSPNFLVPGPVKNQLNEDSVSWRGGLDFRPSRNVLLYASVGRGYKSGSFPVVSATDARQYDPAKQESVTAYELGYKITALNRTLQLNGAFFYYDYRDKQFLGRRIGTPNIFGPLSLLVNVPRSRVAGAEIQAEIMPTKGLHLTIAGTYLDTKIKGPYVDADPSGAFGDHGGESFQYTPKFQTQIDGQYDWDLNGNLAAFVGGGIQFRSKTHSSFGTDQYYDIRDYTLVDLRGGFAIDGGKYRISAYVRNLFDTYYWTNSVRVTDTVVRFAGTPRTFGATVSVRY